jgi:glycosyltransferase involved in cell wall biosynthesis
MLQPGGPDVAEADGLPIVGSRTGDASIVAYTGTVQPESIDDFKVAVRAVALLAAAGRDVAFVHAGKSLPRYVLPEIARGEGLPDDRAYFCGYLPFFRVKRLLDEAHVLVQPGRPNRYNKLRLPSKVQAYLASGTPTVMFAVGLGELLADGEEVLKLNGYDPDELASRIAELLDNPALAAGVGAGGKRAAQRLFDGPTNVAQLLESYRSAIALSVAPPHGRGRGSTCEGSPG